MITIKHAVQLFAAAPLVFACLANAQDVKPDKGSVIDRDTSKASEFEDMEYDQARRSSARFARCIYRRDPDRVIKLLDNGDPMDIDLGGAGLTESNLQKKLGLEWCLSKEAAFGRIQMKLQPGALYTMLTEPAYIAANPKPPTWFAGPFSSGTRRFVASGEKLPRAQSLAEVADCMVKSAPMLSDALLRTDIASHEERGAATALAPVLSGCSYEKQSIALTPANVRGLAASGLWQAERSRARVSEAAN